MKELKSKLETYFCLRNTEPGPKVTHCFSIILNEDTGTYMNTISHPIINTTEFIELHNEILRVINLSSGQEGKYIRSPLSPGFDPTVISRILHKPCKYINTIYLEFDGYDYDMFPPGTSFIIGSLHIIYKPDKESEIQYELFNYNKPI